MDTKLKGDIAVQRAVLAGLQNGWGVLVPVGDRLPYDLVYDVPGVGLRRVQVKTAYKSGSGYTANVRRMKTNRRVYKFERYKPGDFDFAILVAEQTLYVVPAKVFLRFKSSISVHADVSRLRGPTREFCEAWHLIVES